MRVRTHFLKFALLCCFFITANWTFAQLELRIESEKSTLLEGERGGFSFILTNTGTEAETDILVGTTVGTARETVVQSVRVTNGEFEGTWSLPNLPAGGSDTLYFEAISQSPYLYFIAETLSHHIYAGECNSSDCYAGFSCYYGCIPENSSSALYPAEQAKITIESVQCLTISEEEDCHTKYTLRLRNDTDITSPPKYAFTRYSRYESYLDTYYYYNGSNPVSLAAVPANATMEVEVDFGLCQPYDNPEIIVLEEASLISYLVNTSDPPSGASSQIDDRTEISHCYPTPEIDTTDIAIAIESDGILSSDLRGTYRVILTNNGPKTAAAVTVKYGDGFDAFYQDYPYTVSYRASSDYEDSNTYSESADYNGGYANTYYWKVQNLAPGETAILNVSANMNELSSGYFQYGNSVGINVSLIEETTLFDIEASNNSASLSFIRKITDLRLSLNAERPDISRWESGNFIFVLHNDGTVDFADVSVKLFYEDQFVPVGDAAISVSSGTFNRYTGEWTGIESKSFKNDTLLIELFSKKLNPTICAEIISASEADDDSSPANMECGVENEDDEIFFQAEAPYIDLELNLEAIVQEAGKPLIAVYSLYNNSQSIAHNVVVGRTDALDFQLEAMPIISHGDYETTTGQWNLGDLFPYVTARLELQINGDADLMELYAQVISVDEKDEDSTPNNGTCCTSNEDDEIGITDGDFIPHSSKLGATTLQISPNPVQDVLQIKGKYSTETLYTIYDIFGKVHQQGQLASGILELQNLPQGTYVLSVLGKKIPFVRVN